MRGHCCSTFKPSEVTALNGRLEIKDEMAGRNTCCNTELQQLVELSFI